MKKSFAVLALAGLALAAVAAVAPMTVAELSAQAQAVAAAEILSVRAATIATPEGSFPFLFYRARTLRAMVGALPAEFDVRVPGRVSGGKVVTLPDAPPLAVGQRFVLFLKPATGTADATWEVVGFSEGALALVEPAPGQEPLVVVPSSSPGRRVRVRLTDLGATVRAVRLNRGVKP